MQQWSCTETETNRYAFTFEGSRNLIVCSISRFMEFSRAADALYTLRDYKVICYTWMPHNSVYIADSEGIISNFEVVEHE